MFRYPAFGIFPHRVVFFSHAAVSLQYKGFSLKIPTNFSYKNIWMIQSPFKYISKTPLLNYNMIFSF